MLSNRFRSAVASAICAALALVGCQSDRTPASAERAGQTTSPQLDVEATWIRNLPQGIKDFLVHDPAYPFGAPGPDAPAELRFFAKLVGVWGCRINVSDDGRTIVGWPAVWAFKYSAGGFAVEHLYLQDAYHLVPPWQGLGRDSHSVALVVYDSDLPAYRFLGVNNFAGADLGPSSVTMTGKRRDGEITFHPDRQDRARYERDLFYDIAADSFWWRQEESKNRGRTWDVSVRIDCRRRGGSPVP